jgi:tetratricopeptide (TPR) repeat protein
MKNIRKFWIAVVLIIVICHLSIVNCFAQDALYEKAILHYQKAEYDSAIATYEQLLGTGAEAVEVYYNLGNCYYKTGHVAKAIVNYERALKLNPKDEDAEFNLNVAQLKVVDKIEPVPQIFYARWKDTITSLFTSNTWSTLVIVMLWITFILGAFYIFSRQPFIRQVTFILILVFTLLTAGSLFFTHHSYMENVVKKNAIIVASSVYVKSSPDDKGNDLFIIHEGTKVEVLDDFLHWKKIRIANGSIGWLKVNEIEQI